MTRLGYISLAFVLAARRSVATKMLLPPFRVMSFSGGFSNNTISDGAGDVKEAEFANVGEKMMFNGWRKVIRRDIKMPTGKVNSFDIVTQKAGSVTVFVWDRETCTATLVQEFHPGVEQLMYGAVAGMFEDKKHKTPLECAQCELEEEAQLSTDTWIPLLKDDVTDVPFEKYSDNRFHPYLAIDCKLVENPRPMDDEEYIVVKRGVTYDQLMELISTGKMNVISSYTALMGIRKLTELGIPLTK